MPLQDYNCKSCDTSWEELMSRDLNVQVLCPNCSSDKVEKLFPITGGYKMNSGPSSTRPKGAGSRPRKK